MSDIATIKYKNHTFTMVTHGHGDRYVSEHLLNGEIWEPELTNIWYDHIKEGDLVLDIGANLGWYTKIANLKKASCITIEPDPKHFPLLTENCSKDNEVYNICAGADTSDIMLKLSQENFGDNRTSAKGDIVCKQDTIDNLVGNRANKIRAIKIDTQGWEPNIIKGALKTLQGVSDDCLIIIEYWPYGLDQNGFTEDSYNELFDIFKGKPLFVPQRINWNECKNNPHIHSDIVMYKKLNNSLKINIGAGSTHYDGYLNCDYSDLYNPDFVFDLEKDVWPFEDNSVTHVIAHHVLEHLGEGYFHALKELYRVCASEAIIDVRVPHYNHHNFFHDATHKRAVTHVGLGMFGKKKNHRDFLAGDSTSRLGEYLDIDLELLDYNYLVDEKYKELLKHASKKVIEDFSFDKINVVSEIHMMLMAVKGSREDQIKAYYKFYLNREADETGLNYYINSDLPLDEIRDLISTSDERKDKLHGR